MGTSEIVVEELLPQQRYPKKNLDCTDATEKTYCSGTTKKIIVKMEHWN